MMLTSLPWFIHRIILNAPLYILFSTAAHYACSNSDVLQYRTEDVLSLTMTLVIIIIIIIILFAQTIKLEVQ